VIEHDFNHLRAAARESTIGRWVLGVHERVAHAATDAATVQLISRRVARFRDERPDARVRWVALTLALSAAFAFVFSRLVPPYLGTFIPASGFIVAVVLFSAAAGAPHLVLRQWDGSLLRRLTRWLVD
jgi:hypothetical protein